MSKPLIVAVGASAGGLEALRDMFRSAPSHTGMSFVVVQHLSPDFKSMMVELLSRQTALTVETARDGVIPKAETVYVIEPGTLIRLEGDALRIEHTVQRDRVHLPIDHFFESVAIAREGHCVGVVLSGTGSDGSKGLEAIKEHGGTAVVQEPKSAAFDGMPRAALRTGVADLVLAPELIIQELIDLEQSGAAHYFGLDSTHGDHVLRRIISALHERHDLDFNHYKPTTIVRRIQRRMTQLQLRDPRVYANRVQEDALEATALYRDLLIGVTRFHRDPAAIARFAEVAVPRLLTRAGAGPLRLWVAGCSTGEEAYTIAILLMDALEAARIDLDFRIFATDVDSKALSAAGAGEFPMEAAEHLPDLSFQKYFIGRGDYFVARSELRDRILFSRHNVIEDPAFSRLDLISCRNLLIYLKQPIQDRVLRVFASALNEEGLLWLGSSETIGPLDDQFVTLDPRWRIYSGRPGRHRKVVMPIGRPSYAVSRPAAAAPRDRLFKAVESTLLGYAPPSVLVDPNYRLIYRFGDLSALLRVPMGEATLDVRDMLPPDVATVVGTALSRVRGAGGESVLYRAVRTHPDQEGKVHRFDLRARLIRGETPEEDLLALTFEGLAHAAERPPVELREAEVSSEVEAQLFEARREVAEARATLQTTIEELESSNEELQSTNEELIASNEELQSTNEELQSVNEELRTVNTEHQTKLHELTALTREVDDLLSAIDFGVILLDHDLTLTRFNLFAARFVNMLPQDIGRPFNHLTHTMDIHDLPERIREVLGGAPIVSRQVTGRGGEQLHLQILPRREMRMIRGVVITIADITELSTVQREATQLSEALRLTGLAVCILDSDGRVLGFNDAYVQMLGRDPKHLHGVFAHELCVPEEANTVKKAVYRGAAGEGWRGILRGMRPSGEIFWEVVDLIPSPPEHGVSPTLLRLSRELSDVLPQRGAVAGRTGAQREYWHWDPTTDVGYYTSGLAGLWNVETSDLSPTRASESMEDPAPFVMAIEAALRTEKPQTAMVRVPHEVGIHTLSITMQPVRNADGKIVLVGEATVVNEEDDTR